MTTPDPLPAGPWQCLLGHALTLMDEIAEHGRSDPFWTFGGGTVLMLRYGHRLSKDIDIFVPDPQYLGFVNPRISDAASDITTEYEEHAQFVKLLLPEGEIDFVVSPNLTDPGYDQWTLLDRAVKAETAAEIVAKKMWHRGDRVTARDAFIRQRFADIQTLHYTPTFDHAVALATDFLREIPDDEPAPRKSRTR